MATTITKLEGRIGEDVFQPFSVHADVDTSDWSEWTIAAYLYSSNGTVVVSMTEANGGIVKTAEGEFYFWLKKTDTQPASGDPLPRGNYFYQVRRTDADDNTVLAEGPFILKSYKQP